MKIAILTSGLLPVPAILGGAVEELTDHYVALNAVTREHDITIFTCKPTGKALPESPMTATDGTTLSAPTTTFVSIPMHSLRARLRRKLRAVAARLGLHADTSQLVYDYFITDFYLACRKRLLRESWDAIILENRPGYAIDLRQHTNATIILHNHLDNIGPDKARSADICLAADSIITASDYLARRVRSVTDTLPADARPRIMTVHNGIDVEAFASARSASRASFGLSPTDFVIVYSGRLDPIKGIRELIQAMLAIRHKCPCRLLVVGGTFYAGDVGGDPRFLETLRREAAPLRQDIIFTGYVHHSEMPSMLRMADLAVLPSTCQEAFALTVLEAMAAGVPVLTTRSGGVPETCEGVAHIIDIDDNLPQSLAAEIETLRNDATERARMAAAGTERARQFTHKAYARAFLDAIAS